MDFNITSHIYFKAFMRVSLCFLMIQQNKEKNIYPLLCKPQNEVNLYMFYYELKLLILFQFQLKELCNL